LKHLNVEIMLRLQEDGIAAISDTTVQGKHCLRVAINNHRTRCSDLDLLIRQIVRLGREIAIDAGGR
jgi:aromatic-L-amino-acid/L-tryptophan decarboxylase